jgi:hypothetical protein
MGEPGECGESVFEDQVRRDRIDRRNETYAAGVVIKALIDKRRHRDRGRQSFANE